MSKISSSEFKMLKGRIIEGLKCYKSKGATVGDIIEYIDYREHARYTDDEINPLLEELKKSNKIKFKGKRWVPK